MISSAILAENLYPMGVLTLVFEGVLDLGLAVVFLVVLLVAGFDLAVLFLGAVAMGTLRQASSQQLASHRPACRFVMPANR